MKPTGDVSITELVEQHWKRLMRHRERFARAWCAATGLRPDNAVMMHQTITRDGAPVDRTWFEVKPIDLPRPPPERVGWLPNEPPIEERVRRLEAALRVLIRWHGGEPRSTPLHDELDQILRGER